MTAMKSYLTDLLFLTYWPVVLGTPVVVLVCLIAGPRPWTRRLGQTCLWFTGSYLVAVALGLADLSHSTGLRDEAGFAFGLIVMGCVPIGFEFLALLAVVFIRLRRPDG